MHSDEKPLETLLPRSDVDTDQTASERIEVRRASTEIRVGQWFWLLKDADASTESCTHGGSQIVEHRATSNDKRRWAQPPEGKALDWLGCITGIGSNYVMLQEPQIGNSQRGVRVHMDDFWSHLLFEPNADEVIAQRVAGAQADSARLLARIQEITAQLGVGQVNRIEASGQPGTKPVDKEERALVVMSSAVDANAYKAALVEAQTKTLPELFNQVKSANARMLQWMSAGSMAMSAEVEGMSHIDADIKQRLFTVSLYAGLTEEVVMIRDGQPAATQEKVRVMQQRLYADEECLMHYRAGGLEFKDIDAFDRWLAEPEHMNSLLPFPRCVVAMRVRRTPKDRDFDGSLQSAYIIMNLEHQDKRTFLYMRNGDRLYRLSTELEFDEWIFPSKDEFDPGEPLMFSMFGSRVDKVITRAEYEQRLAAEKDRIRTSRDWEDAQKKLPEEQRSSPPYRRADYDIQGHWHSFDKSSVYYDEAAAAVADRLRKYNRVATILQGLFDRSVVFHPHPPVQTWTPDGFARAIELVYDGSGALHNGEAPDFEEYRARLNATLGAGSVVVGQEQFWLEKEAQKENDRIDRDWRTRHKHHHKTFRPHGNGGPGFVAEIAEWKPRSNVGRFTWLRNRMRGAGYYENDWSPIACTLEVPAQHLLNISAYTPGDFKQFFADRRTRAQYLKWAPALLAAEEFHAGNLNAQKPGELSKDRS